MLVQSENVNKTHTKKRMKTPKTFKIKSDRKTLNNGIVNSVVCLLTYRYVKRKLQGDCQRHLIP